MVEDFMFDSICSLHLRGQAGKLWHMLICLLQLCGGRLAGCSTCLLQLCRGRLAGCSTCLLQLWGQACRL